ncbi:MAG: YceI family protein [Gammaproteobacteria bacterium]
MIAFASLSPRATLADAQKFEIDPEHFTVAFLVEHIGYAKTLGLFRKAKGSFSFDEATGALSDIQVTVDTASVDTNHKKRDEHLRSKEFLHVDAHPQMRFAASKVSKTAERSYTIEGALTLIGRTQPITLQASWNKIGEYPFGGVLSKPYVLGVSARGSFKRSAFGMMYAVDNGWVGDEVELILEFEARRQ